MKALLHVMIRRELVGLPAVVDRVITVGRMRGVDQERALLFGIVSGSLEDPALEDKLRAMPEVASVEKDETRHAFEQSADDDAAPVPYRRSGDRW